MPRGDDGACHVRPADRAAGGIREHLLHRHRDAERIEPFHHPLRAQAPHVAQGDESLLHDADVLQVQAEQVRLDVVLDGAELDAGHDAHAEPLARRLCLGEAGDGVMIGKREGMQPLSLGLLDDGRRGQCTVGRRRVAVQVDERARRRRAAGHGR